MFCSYPWEVTFFHVPLLFSSLLSDVLILGLNSKKYLLVDIYMTTSPQALISERAVGKIITIINYPFCK